MEEAIRTHFDGMHLDEKAVSSVLRAYGGERLSFVLACTLQENRGMDGFLRIIRNGLPARRSQKIYIGAEMGIWTM